MHAHEPDPSVLAHCAALVVAHDEADTAALISLGEKVGFGMVTSSAQFSGNDWHIHRVLYFLVHYGIGMEAKRQLLDRVRQLPGIEAAGLASTTPFGGVTTDNPVFAEGLRREFW